MNQHEQNMTPEDIEKIDPTVPNEPHTTEEAAEPPSGFTEVTGPAAFKAKQTTQPAGENQNTANTDDSQKIAQLEEALAQTKDQLIRTVAEMDNLRKRFAREREDAIKYSVSTFARDLLDVSDTFRRALDSIPPTLKEDSKINPLVEGIEAMERALLTVFEKNGIRKIEPIDEPFNPNFHEVMFEAPVPEKPNGTIIQIIEPGYLLHDRLLRPARVGVSKSTGPQEHAVDTQA